MKRLACLLMVGMLLTGCRSDDILTDAPDSEAADTTTPQNYVALPGQAASYSTPSDTTRAFEYAASAYTTNLPQQTTYTTAPSTPTYTTAPTGYTATPAYTAAPAGYATAPTTPTAATSSTGAPYAVQVTNGTTGRLFIEAQDDGGNIFPFGFLYSGQRIAAQPQEARPIQGQLIIVIRDPDRAGAPEVRRYRISPPANYEGKTLGITILPGGRYRLLLDGHVIYNSPDPSQPSPAAAPAPTA